MTGTIMQTISTDITPTDIETPGQTNKITEIMDLIKGGIQIENMMDMGTMTEVMTEVLTESLIITENMIEIMTEIMTDIMTEIMTEMLTEVMRETLSRPMV